jgi:hypothetical protein
METPGQDIMTNTNSLPREVTYDHSLQQLYPLHVLCNPIGVLI